MELIPEKQNQTEWEREQQAPGSWQPSRRHTLTSGFSLKPCGTRHNKSLSLVSAATPRWCFITKDTFGWKNSAEVVLVKTLGSTYPRDQDSKGLDYTPPATVDSSIQMRAGANEFDLRHMCLSSIIPSLSCWTTEPHPPPWPSLLAILGLNL